MDFELVGRSGYLYKTSGVDWPDCLAQTPLAVTSGAMRAGMAYWVDPKIPTENWASWRTFLAFNTVALSQKKKSVKSASLVLPIEANVSDGPWVVELMYMPDNGWGHDLDAGDWDATAGVICQVDAQGKGGVLTFDIDPEHINRAGLTYFRLNAVGDENPVNPPTDERYIDFGRGAVLIVDTGNVNDDVCQNIADVLGAVDYAQFDGVTIRPRLLPVLKAIPEIQIAWEGTDTNLKEGVQIIGATIYYIQSSLTGPAASEPSSIDEGPRKMADIIRRILTEDRDCNGYCSGLVDVSEVLAGALEWRDNWYIGAVVTVRYQRAIGNFNPSLEAFTP